ncbi:MAG: hypothetical protein FWG70_09985 [Oscillospiraceae bacterium]|nr:hypothetical protein [Oscillospiraceae bacterium]
MIQDIITSVEGKASIEKKETLKFQTGTLIPDRSDVNYYDEKGDVLDCMRDVKVPVIKRVLI